MQYLTVGLGMRVALQWVPPTVTLFDVDCDGALAHRMTNVTVR